MLNQVKFDLYQATLEKQSDDSNVIMPMPVPDTESDAMGYLQRLLSPLNWKVIECKHSGKQLNPIGNNDYELVQIKNGSN
ncbi:hypothetical protein ACJGE4_20605 (plasmid) [Bacillus velezensis]|uniref:hypothetical protein n=1 Tax=Bacillus TaxID=1386 RepID=UPI001C0CA5F2|nr:MULTISPECIES: hypothetical protein [Bacillus amyloliquefaciens group]QWQ49671.1 hypothetical protein KOM03_19830 [Bacillus velezensis]QWQ49707.1 hypothetical protein KOM03_20220 [Bacillus velezensis]QYC35323.1 hypothetical protein J5X95_20660 [Bacillus amyloliquefaciens]QYC35366.1 hypothetical protein J5X95_20280 [Bacillus amyloliquefaciens]